ncbi:hypothetical protein [Streptosporangium sp. NPDC003464]
MPAPRIVQMPFNPSSPLPKAIPARSATARLYGPVSVRRVLGAVAAALAACVLSACTFRASGGASSLSPTPSGHRLVNPPPQQAGAFRRIDLWTDGTREKLLSARPSIEGAPVREVVNALHETAKVRKRPRGLAFISYEVTIPADRRQPAVDDALDSFLTVGKKGEDFQLPPGPLGGYARCAEAMVGGSPSGICGWADKGTFGLTYGPTLSAAELRDLFSAFRADVER